MEKLFVGLIAVTFLILLVKYIANKFNDGQERLKQHVRNGNIIPDETESFYTAPKLGDKNLVIELKAKHFENSCYISNDCCSIAVAIKELFKPYHISVGVDELDVNQFSYKIFNGYCSDDYRSDLEFIKSHNLTGNDIIRILTLERLL